MKIANSKQTNKSRRPQESTFIDPQLPSSIFYAFAGREGPRGGAIRGNPCQMSLLPEPPAKPPSPDLHTHCLSWRIDDDVCAVRCWSPAGTEIKLCGHGLLCCGAAWFAQDQAVRQLEMNGLRAAFQAQGDKFWIGLASISCAACRVPHWVKEFFPVMPWRAAEAGDDEGYLVLEWPEGFDLQSLPTPPYALRRRTKRALIVTSRDTQSSSIDVQLRYFAPQHGVPEDTATGSAMRVLATYWMNRDLSEQLTAQQCSRYGGELYSHVRGELTWVGGRVLSASGEVPHVS